MAHIKFYKLNEIYEVQHFLTGGIIGKDVSQGVRGLVGLTITFTTPAFAVTFTKTTNPNQDSDLLRYLEIKAQIEAASASILVVQFGGRIAFIEKTPTTGVVLSGTTETGKAILGFDFNTATTGKVYDSPFSTPPVVPYLIEVYSVNETTHVIVTME